ncbi:MAG: hypothetical protein OXE98_00375 [Hyphomicrobiales bacterium]|nr:hypothetical protein [Hyphomicrobiales bacterium]
MTLLALHNGGATSDDYEFVPPANSAANGTISGNTWTLPTGQREARLQIRAVDDGDNDDGESVTFVLTSLTGATGWSLGSAIQTVDITDNDGGVIGFAETKSKVREPASGTFIHHVDLSVSGMPATPFNLTINVSGSADFGPDADDDANAVFPVSISSASIENGTVKIPFTIRNDDDPETKEKVVLTIPSENNGLSGSGFSLGANTRHTIVIRANDNIVVFSSGAGTIAEGRATLFDITLSINQPLPAGATASVTLLALHNGGATSDDYEFVPPANSAANGTISGNTWTLPTGQREARLQIRAVDDDDDDNGESVTFVLTSLTGATGWSLGGATQSVNITDDD